MRSFVAAMLAFAVALLPAAVSAQPAMRMELGRMSPFYGTGEAHDPLLLDSQPVATSVLQGETVDMGARASGGTGEIVYALVGTFPGISINPTTGVISVAQTVAPGGYPIAISVADGSGREPVVSELTLLTVTALPASAVRLSFANGYGVTFQDWTGIPQGQMTFYMTGSNLAIELTLPCGAITMVVNASKTVPSSWTGDCSNQHGNWVNLWAASTGQPASSPVTDRVLGNGPLGVPTWTLIR